MNNKMRILSYARENAYGIELKDWGTVVVLERDTPESKTNYCPFCGERHLHGTNDGHRIPHCASNDCSYVIGSRVIFRNKHGEIFKGEDGYYVKSSISLEDYHKLKQQKPKRKNGKK